MRRYLTPEDRLIQKHLGSERWRSLDRALQVSRGEISVDMLADQIDALARQLGEPALRHLLSPIRGVPVLNWTGAANGTKALVYGQFSQDISAVGTTTFTITGVGTFTFIGQGAGGGGCGGTGPSGNGGGGGGSSAYTTGTVVVLVAGRTYTLVVPAGGVHGTAANGSAASALTFTGSVEGTMVSLDGGKGGQGPGGGTGTGGGAAGLAASSTGQNLVNGQVGGAGALEAVGRTGGVPGQDTSGAGGGGGGQSGDGAASAQAGAAGKDESGQAVQLDEFGNSAKGGHGGGKDFNGVKTGGGGGGASGIPVGNTSGSDGEQGGMRLAA
jgi:hypothetical protein